MDADLFLQQFGHLAQGEGGIKKLRDVILQLAVRGKLVEQNPADEPASILLKKIAAEKEKLIKEGKIKKQSPLPEINEDEKLFELPQGWEWVQFGNVVVIERGGSPRPIDSFLTNEPDGLNWIKISDTDQGGKYIVSTAQKIRKEGLHKTRMVYPGDFLLTNSMSFGRPYITKIQGCIHDGWLRISPPNTIDKDFLYYLLSSPYIMRAFRASAAGAVVLNLNADKVRDLLILIPPLAEQKRIVAKVDELMALCDKLEAEQKAQRTLKTQAVQSTLHHLTNAESPASFDASLIILERTFGNWFDDLATVKHLRATILQLAVQGKLVPQNPTDEPASVLLKRIEAEKKRLVKEGKIKKQKPTEIISDVPFELPQQWHWSRLGDLCTLITDGTHHTPSYIDSGIPFISVKDIDGRTVSFKNCKYISKEQHDEINQRCNPEEGDILICRIGTIGRVTIVDTKEPFSLFVSVGLIKFLQHLYTPRFAHLVMSSPLLTTQYQQIKAGGSHTNKLNLIDLPKLLLPVASVAEQKRIVAKVDEMMTLCDQLESRISHTQTLCTHLMDSLIHRMTEAA